LHERITKLLEDELSRISDDEQTLLADERKDILSLSPSVPITGLERSNTEKTVSGHSIQSNNQTLPEESNTKSTSTRPGRNTIVYDESGKAWNSEEFESKQKNPYRWFIETQRKIQKSKGPTREEVAASAMVNLLL